MSRWLPVPGRDAPPKLTRQQQNLVNAYIATLQNPHGLRPAIRFPEWVKEYVRLYYSPVRGKFPRSPSRQPIHMPRPRPRPVIVPRPTKEDIKNIKKQALKEKTIYAQKRIADKKLQEKMKKTVEGIQKTNIKQKPTSKLLKPKSFVLARK